MKGWKNRDSKLSDREEDGALVWVLSGTSSCDEFTGKVSWNNTPDQVMAIHAGPCPRLSYTDNSVTRPA